MYRWESTCTPRPAGEVEKAHLARAGTKIRRRVLSVDAALQGVALQRHLPHVQCKTGGNAQLLAHQVHASHKLRDTMLHLDAGVHLHEVEVLHVRIQQKLHGAGALVAHGPGRPDRRLANAGAQLRR